MNKAFVREPEQMADYCPRCGSQGEPVTAETLRAWLTEEQRRGLAEPANFCPAPQCEVVYFDAFERYLLSRDVARPVYPKDPSAPVCACFGLTRDDIEQDVQEGGNTPRQSRGPAGEIAGGQCRHHAANGRSCVPYIQKYFQQCRSQGPTMIAGRRKTQRLIDRHRLALFAVLAVLGVIPDPAPAADNLLENGDFEAGLAGWGNLWTRTPSGQLSLDTQMLHGGKQAARIAHTGTRDWSLNQRQRLTVEAGQIYELSGWLRTEGEGDAVLCVTLRDGRDRVADWSYGGVTAKAGSDWHRLRSRFVIPPGMRSIEPRLIGNRPATVWFDDAQLALVGSLPELKSRKLPETLEVDNATLQATFHTADGRLTLLDRRTGERWNSQTRANVFVLQAAAGDKGLTVRLLDAASMLELTVTIAADPQRPELLLEIAGAGGMGKTIAYPHPFVTESETFLVLPVNEGISYPVAIRLSEPMSYHLYGGHGLCMSWYGVTNGRRGLMTLIETPDDAAVELPRSTSGSAWRRSGNRSSSSSGSARRLRYVLFDQGGYVAMCKRYREHAQQTGLLVTLAEKRQQNPNRGPPDRRGERLVLGPGRVSPSCREMQAAGHPADPVEQPRQAGDAAATERAGRAHQPLRHLPGRRWTRRISPSCTACMPTGPRAAWPKDLTLRRGRPVGSRAGR